jgi:hypothetical protein
MANPTGKNQYGTRGSAARKTVAKALRGARRAALFQRFGSVLARNNFARNAANTMLAQYAARKKR